MQERGWMQGDCVCCFGRPFLSLRRLSLLLCQPYLSCTSLAKAMVGAYARKGLDVWILSVADRRRDAALTACT